MHLVSENDLLEQAYTTCELKIRAVKATALLTG
jgi:hypothetical protein